MWPEMRKLHELNRACALVDRSEDELFQGIAVSRGNNEILYLV
jgi:hypothetical protein